MSRLNELIKELCPDGVEYRELHEVLTIKNGSDYKQFGTGNIPVYGSGGIMTYIDRYAYNKPSVLIPRKGSIDKLYYVEEPFWNVDTIFYTDIDVSQVIPRFVYFCLQMEHLEQYNTAGGVPSLTQKVLNKIKIPVPPLEVQREIVRVLDYFTLLTAELTAELTARKKQYEFYRNKLLTFDEQNDAISEGVWKTLGEICDVRDGTHDSPKETAYGKYLITSKNVKNGTVDYNGAYFISEKDFEQINQRSKVDIWDILFTLIGTIGEVGLVTKEADYAIKNVGLIKTGDELLSRYLKHYLVSSNVKKYIKVNCSKGTQAFLALGKLRGLPVPVLSKEKMKRLVDVLDNFDSICTDLNIGLPAEIEARQKQYEYYRDSLLTFVEKGNIISAEQSRAEQSRLD